MRSPGRGLRWGGHESRWALAQCLPDHGRLQGLEAHVVQRDPEGQELGLIGAQQVAVGLWGQSSVGEGPGTQQGRPSPEEGVRGGGTTKLSFTSCSL